MGSLHGEEVNSMAEEDVYPVTAALRKKIAEAATQDSRWLDTTVGELTRVALEYIGEYEHGSVDTEDLWPAFGTEEELDHEQIRLNIMAAVLLDFIGSFVYMHDSENHEDRG